MADITIHLEPAISGRGLGQLKSALDTLGEEDQLSIVMEAADAHQATRVIKMLEAHGLDYQPRGSHDGRFYYIIARRKR